MAYKHAEIVKAWLHGEPIECFIAGSWRDYATGRYSGMPRFPDHLEFRIKPKTIKYRVALMNCDTGYYTATHDAGDYDLETNVHFVRWISEEQEVEI